MPADAWTLLFPRCPVDEGAHVTTNARELGSLPSLSVPNYNFLFRHLRFFTGFSEDSTVVVIDMGFGVMFWRIFLRLMDHGY